MDSILFRSLMSGEQLNRARPLLPRVNFDLSLIISFEVYFFLLSHENLITELCSYGMGKNKPYC